MVWLTFTNLKRERALEIRSSILSQNSFQPDHTAAQGWFFTIESQQLGLYLQIPKHCTSTPLLGKPSYLFIGCLKYHNSKMSNLVYSENLYLGRHLQERKKAATFGNNETRVKNRNNYKCEFLLSKPYVTLPRLHVHDLAFCLLCLLFYRLAF